MPGTGFQGKGRTERRRVAVFVHDDLATFEFGIAIEIFGLNRPELGVPWYRCQVCGVRPGPVRARGGVSVTAPFGLATLGRADTIVIPGWPPKVKPPGPLLRVLRRAYARGARVVSICSGAFLLAEAGLLDNRRATTHWMYAGEMARRFPMVQIDADVLFVDEGQILTSAGSAAGIDLCLHVVRADYGAAIAAQVARRMVMSPQRDGGQAQFVPAMASSHTDTSLSPLLDWMQRHLDEPLSIDRLARRAHMSTRTFARRFRDVTGTTPHRWLVHQRVIAAQRRLEESGDTIEGVAEAVGLKTAATLRHHFSRTLGTSPTTYRKRFAMSSPPGTS